MTPLERAEKLAVEYACIGSWDPITLKQAVHTAIIEATNAEVEKRRALEAENARLHRIIESLSALPANMRYGIDASDKHLRSQVWNPVTQSYWSIAATSEQHAENVGPPDKDYCLAHANHARKLAEKEKPCDGCGSPSETGCACG